MGIPAESCAVSVVRSVSGWGVLEMLVSIRPTGKPGQLRLYGVRRKAGLAQGAIGTPRHGLPCTCARY